MTFSAKNALALSSSFSEVLSTGRDFLILSERPLETLTVSQDLQVLPPCT